MLGGLWHLLRSGELARVCDWLGALYGLICLIGGEPVRVKDALELMHPSAVDQVHLFQPNRRVMISVQEDRRPLYLPRYLDDSWEMRASLESSNGTQRNMLASID